MAGTQLGTMYWRMEVDRSAFDRGLMEGEAAVQRFGSTASGHFSALTVAAGNLLSNGISALVGGLQNLAGNALQATANYQAMQVGLEGLLAREISQGQEVVKTRQVAIQTSQAEIDKVQELTLKRDTLGAKINEEKERIRQLTEKWGEQGLTVLTHKARLAEMEAQYDTLGQKINKAGSETSGFTTVIDRTRINTMSLKDALPLAEDKAKGLMDQLARIAILSPYQVENVQQTFKMAMAFGYSSDEAMKFTSAILNVAAGTGASNEMLDRMAYNFAQIRMQGKVTAMDVRQLAMAGFDLNGVLQAVGKQFGVTINDYEDFNKAIKSGKITWQQFTDGFKKYADENFGGASARMAKTLNGLKSTFKDVFVLTFPKLLGPAAERVTEFLGKILDGFLKIRETGILDELGEKLGNFVGNAVDGLERFMERVSRFSLGVRTAFAAGGLGNVAKYIGMLISNWWDTSGADWVKETAGKIWQRVTELPGEIKTKIDGWIDTAKGILKDVWDGLHKWWDTSGEDWVKTTAGKIWDFVQKVPGKILELIGSAKDWLVDTWNSIHKWWDENGSTWAETTAGKIKNWLETTKTKVGEKLDVTWANIYLWFSGIKDTIQLWWTQNGDNLTNMLYAHFYLWFNSVKSKILLWWTTDGQTLAEEIGGQIVIILNKATSSVPPPSEWNKGFNELGQKAGEELNKKLADPETQDAIAQQMGQALGAIVARAIDFVIIDIPMLIIGIFKKGEGEDVASDPRNAETLSNLSHTIGETLSVAFENAAKDSIVVGMLSDALRNLLQTGSNAVNWVTETAGVAIKMVSGLMTSIESQVGSVKERWQKFIGDAIINAITWSDTLIESGKSIVDGLISGIKQKGQELTDFILDWIRRHVPAPLLRFFGINDDAGGGGGGGGGDTKSPSRAVDRAASAMNEPTRRSPAFSPATLGNSLAPVSITNYVTVSGGNPETVRRAANQGTIEALRALGYR